MSQQTQQHDGTYDTQLQFFSQESPTVGRSQQYSSNNSSSVSELGKRYTQSISIEASTRAPRTDGSPSRSQRKAAPSPLQTSTSATSPPPSVTPTRTTFVGADYSSTGASLSLYDGPRSPRSPKERLDDLLASERSFYKTEDSIPESAKENTK